MNEVTIFIYKKGKEDEALECFKLAETHGNSFARQQLLALNPYAALCNQMLGDMIGKIKARK